MARATRWMPTASWIWTRWTAIGIFDLAQFFLARPRNPDPPIAVGIHTVGGTVATLERFRRCASAALQATAARKAPWSGRLRPQFSGLGGAGGDEVKGERGGQPARPQRDAGLVSAAGRANSTAGAARGGSGASPRPGACPSISPRSAKSRWWLRWK